MSFASFSPFRAMGGAPALSRAARYRAEVMADAPLAYYRFAEDGGTGAVAADETGQWPGRYVSGNGNQTGPMASGKAAVSRPGLPASLSTDGSGAVPIDSLSAELWVFAPALSNEYARHPWVKGTPGLANCTFAFYFFGLLGGSAAGKLGLYGSPGGSWRALTPLTPVLALNQWHHLVATYDPAVGGRVFVNGVSSATTPPPAGPLLPSNPGVLQIIHMDGVYFAEQALYQSALSPARVAAHYAAAVG